MAFNIHSFVLLQFPLGKIVQSEVSKQFQKEDASKPYPAHDVSPFEWRVYRFASGECISYVNDAV